jgi:hypothetical protein
LNVGSGIIKGGANLMDAVGTVYGLATGDMNNIANQTADQIKASIQEMRSSDFKDNEKLKNQAIAKAGGEGTFNQFVETFKQAGLNPLQTAEFLASNAVSVLVGGGAMAASRLLGAGATVAEAAGILANATIQGGDIAGDTYKRAIEKGATPEEALSSARTVGFLSGVASGLANKFIPGAMSAESVVAAQTAGKMSMTRALAGEIGAELAEEVSGKVMQNIANGDPWNKDVGAVAAQAMLASGALTSGIVAANNSFANSGEAPKTTSQTNDNVFDIKSKLPPSYFQGVNQITSDVSNFLKESANDPSFMDSLRNQTAALALTGAAMFSTGTYASENIKNTTDIQSTINSTVYSAATSGANMNNVISNSVGSTISSAINNKVSADTAIESAVSSSINSAISNNVSSSLAINSSVASAINSALSSNTNANTAISSAVNSAIASTVSASTSNNSAVNINSAINVAINSAVNSAVNNNVNVNEAINSAVTAAVNAAVSNNVNVNEAVNAAVNAVSNLNVNVQDVTNIATKVAEDAVVKKKSIDAINDLINPTISTTPTTPIKSKKKTDEAVAGLGGFTFSGSGKIDPLKESFLKTYMTKDSFKDPLEKLRAMQGADESADKQMMQQQIDPYLARILSERGATQEQPAQDEPQQPAPSLWSFGQEPDSIDKMLPTPNVAPVPEKAFKSGGFVAPLQMASGGAMPLPLLAKSGGALGALPRPDGRMDFRHGAHVAGEGDGQSDDIKAMLADGEFVFPADVVSALGNGSTKAGSDKLYEMMHAIRDRARSTGTKDLPPPALKSPLDYLKKGSKK